MRYQRVVEAVFQARPNRFVAFCLLDGREVKVHVPNTGRCKELLVPGCKVVLSRCTPEQETHRSTLYDLVSVYKGNLLVNIDSQAPNVLVQEALISGRLKPEWDLIFCKREQVFDESRFDIYYQRKLEGGLADIAEDGFVPCPVPPTHTTAGPLESGIRQGFIEVKGVTLEEGGEVFFPDAPTQRGRKHLLELIEARKQGFEAQVLFVVQMAGAIRFHPRCQIDPDFAHALAICVISGVEVLAFGCRVSPDEVVLEDPVPVVDLTPYL